MTAQEHADRCKHPQYALGFATVQLATAVRILAADPWNPTAMAAIEFVRDALETLNATKEES